MPEVNIVIRIPAIIPPIVSIEKELPGLKSFFIRAVNVSVTKINPDDRQNGRRTINV